MNCDSYIGDGVLSFDRVIAPGDTLAVEIPTFCFDGIWVPRLFETWPLGTCLPPGPGPCVLESVLIDGRPQMSGSLRTGVQASRGWRAAPLPVGWEPIDSRRGIQLIVSSTMRAVRFCADLTCELHSRK